MNVNDSLLVLVAYNFAGSTNNFMNQTHKFDTAFDVVNHIKINTQTCKIFTLKGVV